ncbi:hypothetical protein G7054_g14590 [Neopestalotiopsis clavispora]|jgi:hypothetical protein|nr:hypothetical protein G7054_g14590 [Neopestalotiopsis clavispora]
MGFIKILTSVLALASVATAAPVAPSRIQTGVIPSVSETAGPSSTASLDAYNVTSTSGNKSAMVNFTVFDFTEEEVSAAEIDQPESDDAEPSSNNRLHVAVAADAAAAGRSGKLPYKRFPPCYVKCFDSEGIDAKTWPAIGDIRDLTTEEFCHTQIAWTGLWVQQHLRWCTDVECKSCSNTCHHDAGKSYNDLCGRPYLSMDGQ